jgi:thiamine monophosphate synthase
MLQPAAKERQREAVIESNKLRAADPVSADRRSMDLPQESTPAEARKVAAQAAKAVGASTRSVEKAARVERSAPDLLLQVQAGTAPVPPAAAR